MKAADLRKKAKRLIRKGRRIYGGVYALGAGTDVYLAWRKNAEVFRCGRKTITEAITDGVAEWAIDYDTLLELRNAKIVWAGVVLKETGDIYLTSLEKFFTLGKMRNYDSRGGALQKYLPISEFSFIQGTAKI